MHIDDWVDRPHTEEEEPLAAWFREFRQPARVKDRDWLAARTVTCTYQGKRMRCVGASRLGDVWLTSKPTGGYEVRPNFDDCTDWKVEQPVEA